MKHGSTLAALILVMSAGGAVAQIPAIGGGFESMAPRIRPDGGSLTPVVLTYLATLQQGADLRSLGERTVQVSRSSYAGLSAWEIVETRGAGSSAAVDTLIVDFQTLAPFHWGAAQPMPSAGGGLPPVGARVTAEFRADTMMGVMSSPAGRRSLMAQLQPGSYITAAHFEVALRGLPIAAPNWRDSTWLAVSGIGKSSSVAASVAVTGEEKILTTAGTFECWIITLATDLGRTQYWVSKPDRIVVQSQQVVPETGAVLQYQLSRISHSTP